LTQNANTLSATAPSTDSPAPPAGATAAVISSFAGWTLDAFDYFIVIMCLTAIGATFGKSVQTMAIVTTATLALRPVGALVFGLMADRWGRRMPLMLNLVFYSVIQVFSGLAHSFGTFLILRALFGIGMGGEWGVGASLAMEKVPPRLRGLLSGLLQEGYALGYLLAALAYWAIFPHWGWRPLFFVGGLPALLAAFVRFFVPESEAWHATRRQSLGQIMGDLLRHWPTLLYITLLMMGMNLASHGTQDLYPVFLEKDWHLGPQGKAVVTALTMLGAISGGLAFGRWSDRIGRKKAMLWALLGAVLAVPLWVHAPRLMLIAVGGIIMQFMVQGAWGIIPAHITELAPQTVRGLLPGLAYQMGALLASPVSVAQARLSARGHSYASVMTVTCLVIFGLAMVIIWAGPERHGRRFGIVSES
jgi:SHS family lactate transporter-like MFS transporter